MIEVLVVIFVLVVLILVGCPIFLALGISGLVGFSLIGGIFNLASLPSAMYGQIDSFILVAVPLFIFMGEILAKSGLGVDLFSTLSKWLYRIPGGLAITSIFACAIFGAACGVSIAGVGAIAPLAVPEMLKRGYDRRLASGAMAASGALATLIPPSIVMIVYGSISHTSVAKLFIGGIIPGIVLALMMAFYVLMRVILNPKLAPAAVDLWNVTWRERFRSLIAIAPVILLAATILICLYSGVATPTEVGAIGAVGAILISRFVYKSLTFKIFLDILSSTARATISVCMIVACALCFGNFLNVMRVPDELAKFALSLTLPPEGIIIIFMILLILLGMFVDGLSMIVITTPILLPAILSMGLSPLWFGIILALNIEMAVISPPVGLNLYVLKSVVPQLSITEIIAGAMPFLIVEFLCLLLFIFFPTLALWLPNLMQ